jgi:linoleoyl-CoA desaturase
MESSVKVKFNTQQDTEFFKVLGKRVNQYFLENNTHRYGSLTMKVKTVFMIILYFAPLIILLTGHVPNLWIHYLLWTLIGFGMAGYGLSVMHDANHGAYSKKKWINLTLGYILNFVGGYHINWKIQHNVLHHSYTNIVGHDEDIQKGVLRFSSYQKRKFIHRFQAFYAPFLYLIMTLYWVLFKDLVDFGRYKKRGLYKLQGRTNGQALLEIILTKLAYWVLTFILPMMMSPFAWWHTLLGFLLLQAICGLILALIFQPAHVGEETEFFVTKENGSIENNWAIHQLQTTANFANKSVIFSWFVGGLNFQIEHHLFPNICHVHYKRISKIVKETAKEFQLPYHEHRTFLHAVWSHFKHLHHLSKMA